MTEKHCKTKDDEQEAEEMSCETECDFDEHEGDGAEGYECDKCGR